MSSEAKAAAGYFIAVAWVEVARWSYPKVGNLLAFLDREYVIARFQELPFARLDCWRETATSEADLEKWFTQNAEKISGKTWTTEMEGDVAAFEILVEMKDGKRQLKRVLVQGHEASGLLPGLLA